MSPFSQFLPLVIPVPETAVEHPAEAFIPVGYLRFDDAAVRIFSVLPCFHSFAITAHNGIDIFRSAGTAFDLQHPHACIQHLIEEMNGLQVFGAHDILVVHIQLQI